MCVLTLWLSRLGLDRGDSFVMAEAYAVIENGQDALTFEDGRPNFTRLSIHQSHEDALVAMELVEGDRYLFLYNNGSRGRNTVYICTTHVGCPKLMRLVRGADEGDENSVALEESGSHGRWRFALETSGKHKGNHSDVPTSGIATALKRDVDSILVGGADPAKCVEFLKQRYKGDDIRLRLMPDEEQLKSRKAQLRRTLQGGWAIQTPAALLKWVSGRMFETAGDFFGAPDARTFDDSVCESMDDLIVLVQSRRRHGRSPGQVVWYRFSSRQVFSNVERSI